MSVAEFSIRRPVTTAVAANSGTIVISTK